ncbi:Uncharacterised protein [Candidatus Gugararchaeum adminiculabundum]|nr:Uncharacterised protein [Candidatus Gugararchaeum adminiculabundum]
MAYEKTPAWKKIIDEKELEQKILDYQGKKSAKIKVQEEAGAGKKFSSVYQHFKKEEYDEAHPTKLFEKVCAPAEAVPFAAPEIARNYLEKNIELADLKVTAKSVFYTSIGLFAITMLFALVLFLFGGVFQLCILVPFAILYYLLTYPSYRATTNTMQMQNDMLLATLYMAIYLRLNPTMEGATEFASKHLEGPLATDFKKALWDVDCRKYASIDMALSERSKKWQKWDENFVRTLDLLRSSLLENDQEKRQDLINNALDSQLESTFVRMKTYANKLSNPIQLIFTVFVIVPLMTLTVIPIAGIFMSAQISPLILIALFNLIIPFATLYYSLRTLSKRPGSFAINISKHPKVPPEGTFRAFGSNVPVWPVAVVIGLIFASLGLFSLNEVFTYSTQSNTGNIYEYLWMMAKSWSLAAGAAAALASYFYLSSFQRVEIRDEIRKIEDEFRSGLRELGVLLDQNIPLESAISSLVDEYRRFNMDKSSMASFFSQIIERVKGLGLTFSKALFDEENGVIRSFPSVIIEDVMRAIVESLDKGPKQVALACNTISKYLDKVSEINKLVYTLLAETTNSISLLTAMVIPLIGAVAASMGTLLTRFLQMIAERLLELANSFGSAFGASFSFGEVLPLNLKEVIPPTVLQLIVGFYVIEMIIILAMLQDGIENGYDRTTRNVRIGRQLANGFAIYTLLLFASILFLNMLAIGV